MISPYIAPGIHRTIEEIIAEVWMIDPEELKSRSRYRELTEVRHFGMYYRRNVLKMSPTRIAKIYNRDHSTICYACSSVENLLRYDKDFRQRAEDAIQKLIEAGYGAHTDN